jgi:hypothetical protein
MSKPIFRIGLEIETCFINKPLRICYGVKGCEMNDLKTHGEHIIRFLQTTQDEFSLFKGVPENIIYCEHTPKRQLKNCGVELIINSKREIFTNGQILIDSSGKSIMDELMASINDWVTNNITRCYNISGISDADSAEYGFPDPPSSCGVHVHISAPFLDSVNITIKSLFKILVYFHWHTLNYQDIFKKLNTNYITEGWSDAPYKTLMDLNFKIPDAKQIDDMINNPRQNEKLIEYFVNGLPGQTYMGKGGQDRGVEESNIIIVDPIYKNTYPHFEFRGHNDLIRSIEGVDSDRVALIYNHLINYINNIYNLFHIVTVKVNKAIAAWDTNATMGPGMEPGPEPEPELPSLNADEWTGKYGGGSKRRCKLKTKKRKSKRKSRKLRRKSNRKRKSTRRKYKFI